MRIYCTICCAEKREEEDLLPAIDRYVSKRIQMVADCAEKDGVHMFIFSGKYGLIPPHYPIPNYDLKLTSTEVTAMAEKLSEQLIDFEVTAVVWFGPHLEAYPGYKPYFDALKNACVRHQINLISAHIEADESLT